MLDRRVRGECVVAALTYFFPPPRGFVVGAIVPSPSPSRPVPGSGGSTKGALMIARRLGACSTLLILLAASPVLAAPGDFDPSFGTGGVVVGPSGSVFTDVERQPDGKLVAVG